MRILAPAIAASAALLLAPGQARAAEGRAQLVVSVRVVRSIALSIGDSSADGLQARVHRGGSGAIGVFVPSSSSGAHLVRADGPGAPSGGKVVVLVDGSPAAIHFAHAAVEEVKRPD